MKLGASLLLLLAGCNAPVRAPGGGFVSTNPCADAILIRLVSRERIAAISHYSREPSATSIPIAIAGRFRVTAGTAEEVIALNPALVLTSSFTPLATRAAYERAGLKLVLLDSPTTIAASKAQVMQVAKAVGAAARGRAIVANIDAALRSASPPRGANKPAALLFISGDLANGSGTLLDELMNLAGFRNAAATYGLRATGTIPAETIAMHPPDIVMAPDSGGRTAALRRQLLPHTRMADFPRTLVNCGGPTIIPALARMRAIRASWQ